MPRSDSPEARPVIGVCFVMVPEVALSKVSSMLPLGKAMMVSARHGRRAAAARKVVSSSFFLGTIRVDSGA